MISPVEIELEFFLYYNKCSLHNLAKDITYEIMFGELKDWRKNEMK